MEAVKLFQDHGEQISVGSAQRALGGISLAQGDFDEGRAWFQDGLHMALLIGHRDGIPIALEGIAASLAALGQLERAARLWGTAQAVHEELHGSSRDSEIPFARLPQLSPQLIAISKHFCESGWQAAQAMGYEAPLDTTIATLRELETV